MSILKIWLMPLMCFFVLIQDNKETKNPLVKVDVEGNIKNMEVVNLSQFTDNIRYIPFESIDNHYFLDNASFSLSGNQILVEGRDGCQLYDSEGNFISMIGSIGTGPEEYKYCKLIGFGDGNKIYIQSLYDLYEYKNTGAFEKKYSKAFLLEDIYLINSVSTINNGLFFGHVPNSTGQIKYKALVTDKLGEIQYRYNNFILFNRDRAISSTYENFAHIYSFNGSIFYKELYNDTLFCLNDKYQLIPSYVFNMDKYKVPISKRAKMPLTEGIKDLQIWNVFQTDKYLFIRFAFNDLFPAKRLTPKETEFEGVVLWYNTRDVLGIYDKTNGDLTFCEPTSTDNPLFTSGIYNDIDAGARFFPSKMLNDSTMAMWIDAKELKDHVESSDFKRSVPKYPEKKKALEELASKLTIYDNPVLMVVTFK